MPKKTTKLAEPKAPRIYWGPDIPMRVIRRFARQVAEKFQPDKIILFGSFAYGTPHKDSDVDILVIRDTWNEISLATQIRNAIDSPFPMDLIVRTPKHMKWLLDERESFHTEITTRGKVLYEKIHKGVGGQGRGRSSARPARRTRQAAL